MVNLGQKVALIPFLICNKGGLKTTYIERSIQLCIVILLP